jgi:hypothetical protein
MQENGHQDARKLHARLNHPIIDADGHWLEYGPVMREEFRRIGGEAAVEALALAMSSASTALYPPMRRNSWRMSGWNSAQCPSASMIGWFSRPRSFRASF